MNQEKRRFFEYGTTLWAIETSKLSAFDSYEDCFAANLDTIPRWSAGCLMQDLQSLGDFYVFSTIHSLKNLANMNLTQSQVYNFTEITFFVRFLSSGGPVSMWLSDTAYGYFGFLALDDDSMVEIDALAIKCSSIEALTPHCNFHRFGDSLVTDIRVSTEVIAADGTTVCKQSKNFDSPTKGQVFKLRRRRAYNDGALFDHRSMLPVVWEHDAYDVGCSGSAIYCRDVSNGVLQLHAFTHSAYRKCVFGVNAKACIDAISAHFPVTLHVHHQRLVIVPEVPRRISADRESEDEGGAEKARLLRQSLPSACRQQ